MPMAVRTHDLSASISANWNACSYAERKKKKTIQLTNILLRKTSYQEKKLRLINYRDSFLSIGLPWTKKERARIHHEKCSAVSQLGNNLPPPDNVLVRWKRNVWWQRYRCIQESKTSNDLMMPWKKWQWKTASFAVNSRGLRQSRPNLFKRFLLKKFNHSSTKQVLMLKHGALEIFLALIPLPFAVRLCN